MNLLKRFHNNNNKKITNKIDLTINKKDKEYNEDEMIKWHSSMDLVILELLVNKDKQCAGEIERNIKSKPVYRDKRLINFVASSAYGKVKELENKGYVKGTQRKLTKKKEIREYSITEKGKNYLNRLLIGKIENSIGNYLINFNYTIFLMDYIDNKEKLKYLDNIKSEVLRKKDINEQESYDEGYTNRIIYNQKRCILDALLQWIIETEFDLKIEEK